MTTTTPTLTPSSYATRARVLVQTAAKLGVTLTVGTTDGVMTAYVGFAPGDRDAYVRAENACLRVLALAPMVYPGTVWGTDSGSVGGHAGLSGGYCRMNKSGLQKRLCAAVDRTVL